MTVTFLLFLLAALILISLLIWAARPQIQETRSADEVLQALAEDRHYHHLPQILQSLRPEDIDFLKRCGQPRLVRRIRNDRKRIALRYLAEFRKDFGLLLEAAGVLAMMAPDLAAMREWERLKLSMGFAIHCQYLSWRLRLGLAPWQAFSKLSEMASAMTLQLETVTTRMAERSAIASELHSYSE